MSLYFKTFAGRTIYRSSSMEVQQNRWYRWLMFQNRTHIQTLIQRKHPHKAAMPYLYPFTLDLRTQPGPTCLLGLGGGGLLHMAAPCLQQHPITAVELSAEVITLGYQYFMLDTIPSLTILQQDAHTFINSDQSTYQHILIDIYSDTSFPENCAQQVFFQQCKQHLLPNGFLAINLVNVQQELPILERIKSVFHNATVCIPVPSSTNMIVLATQSKPALLAFITSHPKLSAFIWDPGFGYMAQFSKTTAEPRSFRWI